MKHCFICGVVIFQFLTKINIALMDKEKIPVTIITGFLGSGKTTLVNEIINKKYRKKKFAIIENEFGEIGIDGGLLMNADENIFELANGCICCSLNEDFNNVLVNLLESPYKFDHLLVETTGIADPTTIIRAFVSSELIQTKFVIDSVICLADAVNIEDLLDEQHEAQVQLALSDVILLNKIDSINPAYAVRLEKRLRAMNPMALFHPVQFANLNDIDLLDIYAYSSREVQASALSFFPVGKQEVKEPQRPVVLSNVPEHSHQHDISSEGFVIPGELDPRKFLLWIEPFLYFNPSTLYRAKGILCFQGKKERFVFQAVRDKFTLEPAENKNDEVRESKLVFIGKKLQRDSLEDNLLQLKATENIQL